jgi:hypothetical protein
MTQNRRSLSPALAAKGRNAINLSWFKDICYPHELHMAYKLNKKKKSTFPKEIRQYA